MEIVDVPSVTVVDIDIKPDSDKNSINPRKKGAIPVAILGSVDFDAAQVEISSLEFGPDGAKPIHTGHIADVNYDSFADLVIHFKAPHTGLACGDRDATISGHLFSGDSFIGSDKLRTVGCK